MSKLYNFWRLVIVLAGAITWLALAGSSSAEPAAQKRDPFQLPAILAGLSGVAQPVQPVQPVQPDASLQAAGEQAIRPAPLRLRAVIYDGKRSLVNINGRILALGESLDEGFRLVRVGERDAVLLKDGKEHRLYVEGAGH